MGVIEVTVIVCVVGYSTVRYCIEGKMLALKLRGDAISEFVEAVNHPAASLEYKLQALSLFVKAGESPSEACRAKLIMKVKNKNLCESFVCAINEDYELSKYYLRIYKEARYRLTAIADIFSTNESRLDELSHVSELVHLIDLCLLAEKSEIDCVKLVPRLIFLTNYFEKLPILINDEKRLDLDIGLEYLNVPNFFRKAAE